LSFCEQLEFERRTLQKELSDLGHLKGGLLSSKDTPAVSLMDDANQQSKTVCQLEDTNISQEEEEDSAPGNSNDSHMTQGVVAPVDSAE
jgi:hypothetical protein